MANNATININASPEFVQQSQIHVHVETSMTVLFHQIKTVLMVTAFIKINKMENHVFKIRHANRDIV